MNETLTEIQSLISLRQYLVAACNNASVDRGVVNYLTDLSLLVDRKIIQLLMTTKFKEYLNWDQHLETRYQASKTNNRVKEEAMAAMGQQGTVRRSR